MNKLKEHTVALMWRSYLEIFSTLSCINLQYTKIQRNHPQSDMCRKSLQLALHLVMNDCCFPSWMKKTKNELFLHPNLILLLKAIPKQSIKARQKKTAIKPNWLKEEIKLSLLAWHDRDRKLYKIYN